MQILNLQTVKHYKWLHKHALPKYIDFLVKLLKFWHGFHGFFFQIIKLQLARNQHSESEKFTHLSKPTDFHLGLATLTTTLNWAPGAFFAGPWNVTNYHGPQKMIFQDISRVWALRSVHVLSRVSLSSSMFSWWRGTKKKGIMPLRKGVSSLRKSLDHWILDFFLALHLLYSEKECFYVVFSNSLARSPVTNSGQKKNLLRKISSHLLPQSPVSSLNYPPESIFQSHLPT